MVEQFSVISQHWLRFAKSSLIAAKTLTPVEGMRLEEICFLLQQSVEKSLKTVLVYHGINPQKTHNMSFLLNEIKNLTDIPEWMTDVLELQDFAVRDRYPGVSEELSDIEELEGLKILAQDVFDWAQELISK